MSHELTRARITIDVTTKTGAGIKVVFASHMKDASRPATPTEVLIAAADELARIAELAGCGPEVAVAVAEARARVNTWQLTGVKP